MGRPSILPSVVAVISNLGVALLKSFKANVAVCCSIEFSPLFMSQRFHRLFGKRMINLLA